MRKVILTMDEQNKYQTIKRLVDSNGNKIKGDRPTQKGTVPNSFFYLGKSAKRGQALKLKILNNLDANFCYTSNITRA